MPAFAPSFSISIQAAPELVWDLLRDVQTWPQWNDFTPQATLKSSSAQQDSRNDSIIQVGDVYKFTVQKRVDGELKNVPGGSVEEITEAVEPGAATEGAPDAGDDEQSQPASKTDQDRSVWCAVWAQRLLPALLLRTKRRNEIRRTDGGCDFTTSITFDGPMAWIITTMNGSMVIGGLQLCAEGLKREAEKRATQHA